VSNDFTRTKLNILVKMSLLRKISYKFSKKANNKKPLDFNFKENAFLVNNTTIISSNKNEKDNITNFSYYYVKYRIGPNTYFTFGNRNYLYPPFETTLNEHNTRLKIQASNEYLNKKYDYDDITIDILLFGDIYNISDKRFVEELMGPYKTFNGYSDDCNDLSNILGWIYKTVRGLNVTQIKYMLDGEVKRIITVEPFGDVYIKNPSPITKKSIRN
jgi:hypothetical protein